MIRPRTYAVPADIPEYTLETSDQWYAAFDETRDDVNSLARAIADSCAAREPMSERTFYVARYRENKARLAKFRAALDARIYANKATLHE